MVWKCPDCGYSGEYKQVAIHHGWKHDGNFLVKVIGRDRLADLYSDMGSQSIAERLGVSKPAVQTAIEESGIGLRNRQESAEQRANRDWDEHPFGIDGARELPVFNHTPDGHERVSFKQQNVPIHRLCAVAWFGIDSVVGNDIHHENGMPWDNRESNLQPLTHGEHSSHHQSVLTESECEKIRSAFDSSTCKELAAEYDVSISTVSRHARGDCNHG